LRGARQIRVPWSNPRVLLFNKETYRLDDINNNSIGGCGGFASILWHEGPKFVEVDGGFEVLISLKVEVTLTLLTEVPWMAAKS
jgi:hypothetical protein